jgi:hypothetical protein
MQKRSLPLILTVAAAIGLGIGITRLSSTRAADAPASAIYAQLSSPDSQMPTAGPLLVKMTSNDALSGLEHSDKEKTDTITVKTPGAYFMVAAVQVGKDSAGEPGDYMDVWIKQNGKDVDNSNCRQVIHDAKFTTVMVCQGIAECKAGDTFNVAIAGKGVGIKAIKPEGEPVVPSIIFSMYKIN